MDREVRLLWSGGWDSTFRLLVISQEEGVIVRPMYVRDRVKKGMACELSAMHDILPLVRAQARARVLDVELYDRSAILRDHPDEEVSAAYARLAGQYQLGYQYELFALLCRGLDVRAECAVENSVRSKVKAAIEEHCSLVPCAEEPLDGVVRLRAVALGENKDAELVFGRLDLGMLKVSKVDARRVSQEQGWMPIMSKTWFCHTPVNGRPCGTCNPCRDAMREGMAWRMPLASQLRYYAWSLRSAVELARRHACFWLRTP